MSFHIPDCFLWDWTVSAESRGIMSHKPDRDCESLIWLILWLFFFLPLFSKFLQCVKQLGLQAMPLKHSDKWLGAVFGFNCQFNISRHHLGKAFQMIVTDPPVCGFVGDYLDCSCWGRKHISWAGSPTSSYKKGCCVLAWVLACSH